MYMNIIIVFFDSRDSEIKFNVAKLMFAESVSLLNLNLNVTL